MQHVTHYDMIVVHQGDPDCVETAVVWAINTVANSVPSEVRKLRKMRHFWANFTNIEP